jgi:IS5 family transposase
MDNLIELYCAVDDFMQFFSVEWKRTLLTSGERRRIKPSKLSPSEVMTIIILFHQSNYRTLKHFYCGYVCTYLKSDFRQLVSYSQFVRLEKSILIPLCAYLQSRKGEMTGISYVDSTPISVCHNRRIARHKTFAGIAARGKTTMGWFYGFKLHLVVNEKGELLSFFITPGNVDDRQPLKKLTKGLSGKLFGDKGYLSKKYFKELLTQGVTLVTNIKKNMKNRLIPIMDKVLLRKRYIIETINDQLKNISQIEHPRHRSVENFMVNLIAGLVAYTHQPNKPSIKFNYPYKRNALTLICN